MSAKPIKAFALAKIMQSPNYNNISKNFLGYEGVFLV